MALSREEIKKQLLEEIRVDYPDIELSDKINLKIDDCVEAELKEQELKTPDATQAYQFEKNALIFMLEIARLPYQTNNNPFEKLSQQLEMAKHSKNNELIANAESRLSQAIQIEKHIPAVLQKFNLEEKNPSSILLNAAREYAQLDIVIEEAKKRLDEEQKINKPKHPLIAPDAELYRRTAAATVAPKSHHTITPSDERIKKGVFRTILPKDPNVKANYTIFSQQFNTQKDIEFYKRRIAKKEKELENLSKENENKPPKSVP